MHLKRLIFRSWYYFRQGYGQFLSLPISFIGWITAIYYLAVDNLPFLKDLFPKFQIFVVFTIIVVLPLGIVCGWLYFKGYLRRMYRSEQDVQAEASPYTTEIFTPVNWPQVEMGIESMKQLNERLGMKVDTTKVEEQLRKSKEYFKVKK